MASSSSELLEAVCSERETVDTETLEHVLTLGVELAREGRPARNGGLPFAPRRPTLGSPAV